jgi:hypothetical protein
MLARRFTKDEFVALACEVDAGFHLDACAEMIANIDRYGDTDRDLGGVDVSAVRGFFGGWAAELRADRERS